MDHVWWKLTNCPSIPLARDEEHASEGPADRMRSSFAGKPTKLIRENVTRSDAMSSRRDAGKKGTTSRRDLLPSFYTSLDTVRSRPIRASFHQTAEEGRRFREQWKKSAGARRRSIGIWNWKLGRFRWNFLKPRVFEELWRKRGIELLYRVTGF